MKTQNITFSRFAEYNSFGIPDETINTLEQNNIIPIITLTENDYKFLDCPPPAENAPLLLFLLGREENIYAVNFNYVKAMLQSGANIRFLTYQNIDYHLPEADGIILPGGNFVSPDEFYTDPQTKSAVYEPRAKAYLFLIREAEKRGLPLLGICAGAQMIAGMHGFKMYRDIKTYTNSELEHKNKHLQAHTVTVYPNTLLHKILGCDKIETNSRHREAIVADENNKDLEIYAFSYDDTPEAWGNEQKNILCIQWHPEDFAAQGNQTMQNIYNWLTDQARLFQKQKPQR